MRFTIQIVYNSYEKNTFSKFNELNLSVEFFGTVQRLIRLRRQFKEVLHIVGERVRVYRHIHM
jgi:hypothetical protein